MDDTSAPSSRSKSSIPFLPRLIATGLFSGYSPFAPGTAGTLAGLLLYCIPGMENPIVLSVSSVLLFMLGVPAAATVARIVGDEQTESTKATKALFQPGTMHAPDPSIVVVDEIVGMWISVLALPKSVPVAIAAFLAFRLFDIVKPFPARQIERYPNGWGIMLDDIVAGVYANAAVRILLALLPWMAGA